LLVFGGFLAFYATSMNFLFWRLRSAVPYTATTKITYPECAILENSPGFKTHGQERRQKQDVMKDKSSFSHKPISRYARSSTEKLCTLLHVPDKVPVRRIQIQELVIYDVREDELDALVRGGQASNCWTHGVWALSTALTLMSFLFVPNLPHILFAGFGLLTTFGVGVGCILLFMSFKERKSLNKIVADIKTRRSCMAL
jgi:hypothetical protein